MKENENTSLLNGQSAPSFVQKALPSKPSLNRSLGAGCVPLILSQGSPDHCSNSFQAHPGRLARASHGIL